MNDVEHDHCQRCGDDYQGRLSQAEERIKELEAEKKMMFDEMCNMCFCKRHLCNRCGYIEEIPDRCKNEQIRDKIFRKLSKP